MTVKIKNRWTKTRENLKIMTLGTLDLNSCYQNTAIKNEFMRDMSLSFIVNDKEFPAEFKKKPAFFFANLPYYYYY